MTSVLGIVASTRKLGNTELMVRVALEGAEESGAETVILRLTDFNIKPCTGCLTCIIKDQDCPQGDDAELVYRAILSADGVILGAPVYFLWPMGPAKMLIDRTFMFEHLAPDRHWKPAGMIATLGRKQGWSGFSVPLLASSLLFARYWPTEVLLAPAPGPGEILLDRDAVERARGMGRKLLASQRVFPTQGSHCPICFGEAFELREGGRVECPTCWIRGEVAGEQGGKVQIRFDDDWPSRNRWVPGEMANHMNNWVRASQAKFLNNLDAIREARTPFKDRQVNWIKPPIR